MSRLHQPRLLLVVQECALREFAVSPLLHDASFDCSVSTLQLENVFFPCLFCLGTLDRLFAQITPFSVKLIQRQNQRAHLEASEQLHLVTAAHK